MLYSRFEIDSLKLNGSIGMAQYPFFSPISLWKMSLTCVNEVRRHIERINVRRFSNEIEVHKKLV